MDARKVSYMVYVSYLEYAADATPQARFCEYNGDMSASDRLREARKRAGFASAKEAADRMGWNLNTYTSHENGNRRFGVDKARTYARAYGADPYWLLEGRGNKPAVEAAVEVPLVGYVGAGSQIHPIDDHAKGAALEYIAAPPHADAGSVAVKVRGESMEPVLHEGDIVVYRRRSQAINEMVGRERVVWLSDGRVMIKDMWPGQQPGRFNLMSHNASPILDAEVTHAAKIEWIKKA